jgi:hypothetical protein
MEARSPPMSMPAWSSGTFDTSGFYPLNAEVEGCGRCLSA